MGDLVYAASGTSVEILSAATGDRYEPSRDAAPRVETVGVSASPRSIVGAGPTGRVWEVEVAGVGTPRATLGDEAVYVSGLEGTIRALSRADGTLLWERDVGVALGPPVSHDGVLVPGTDGSLASFTPDGVQRWHIRDLHGLRAHLRPVVADGVVVTVANGTLVGTDLVDGSLRWRTDLGWGRLEQPVPAGDIVVIGGRGVDRIWAVNANDGTVRWRRPGPPGVSRAPAVMDGVVHVAGLGGVVALLDVSTGEVLTSVRLGGRPTGDIRADRGRLYVPATTGVLAVDVR